MVGPVWPESQEQVGLRRPKLPGRAGNTMATYLGIPVRRTVETIQTGMPWISGRNPAYFPSRISAHEEKVGHETLFDPRHPVPSAEPVLSKVEGFRMTPQWVWSWWRRRWPGCRLFPRSFVAALLKMTWRKDILAEFWAESESRWGKPILTLRSCPWCWGPGRGPLGLVLRRL